MTGVHALIVIVLVTCKHCLSELLFKGYHKSARLFSTSQLKTIKERKVEVERVEDLGLQFGLHLRQWSVRIVQCLSPISLVALRR
jgi:hypothetical protein